MPIKINKNVNNKAPSFGALPKPLKIFEGDKTLKLINRMGSFSSPHQRLFLGVTALMTQPFIDLYNKNVDEKTRVVSCARTLAKNIVGTIVGITVRELCIKSIDLCTEIDAEKIAKETRPFVKKLKKALLPSNVEFKKVSRELVKHRQALGTFIALGVMLITNFAIDLPLTKIMTNWFTKKFEKSAKKKMEKEAQIKQQGGLK